MEPFMERLRFTTRVRNWRNDPLYLLRWSTSDCGVAPSPRSRCCRWRAASARHWSGDPSARPGRPLCGRRSGRSRLLAQLLAAGAPGGSGAG